MEGETRYCTNCKRDISVANFVMHEVHCRRHIILCQHCDDAIPKQEMEQHYNDLHAPMPCALCKKQITKDKMEKHLELECRQKPIRCEYCELSFPKEQIEAHTGYCGSRTECCPLCKQYIMLKDMIQHESSGCSCPEPKPSAAPSAASDPFNMASLGEYLDPQNGLNENFPEFVENHYGEGRQDFVASLLKDNLSRRHESRRMAANGRRSSRKKNTNFDRDKGNVPTEDTDWQAIPPELDYDTMLALQLAHDDWAQDENSLNNGQQDGLNIRESGSTTENHQRSTQNRLQGTDQDRVPPESSTNTYKDEDMCIPCDLCGSDIPMGDYLNHAETCRGAGSISSPGHQMDRNNEWATTTSGPQQRASIPVIDNLRPSLSPLQSNRTFGTLTSGVGNNDTSDYEQAVVLPCEFCEQIFPSEIILQHQSVCPSNGLVTPRTGTPFLSQRSPATNQIAAGQAPDSESLSSLLSRTKPKHQPEPSLASFVSDDEEEEGEPRSNFFRDQNYTTNVLESSSNKYSPALDRFDDSVTRPPRRSSRQLSAEDVEGDSVLPANDVRRPNRSEQRTRARLDQLLHEDNPINRPRPSQGTRRPPKSRTGLEAAATGGTREKQVPVDSRTVMKELDRGASTVSRTQKATRQQRPVPGASEPASSSRELPAGNTSSSSRTRQRGNQVFNPHLRLKPDHNPRQRQP